MDNKNLNKSTKQLDKNTEAVVSIIKSFEIEMTQLHDHDPSIFDCVWKASSFRFQLRLFPLGVVEKVELEAGSDPLICVLLLKEKSEQVLKSIISFDVRNGHLIICDEDEDIQVFAKDLWNLLVALEESH